MAGLDLVQALIGNASAESVIEMQLAENLQREDLCTPTRSARRCTGSIGISARIAPASREVRRQHGGFSRENSRVGGAVTRFNEWCVATDVEVPTHKLNLLSADAAKEPHAIKIISEAIPDYYAAPSRVADLLRKLGKVAAAEYVEQKLPTTLSIKSGDLGEVLCTAYVSEATSYTRGIKRLRWKDHRNMSMRGEDVLAFNLSAAGGTLKVLKAEVKSRASMSSGVIATARDALSSNRGLPSPHAISFVADRLHETGETGLADALDKAQLKDGLNVSQVAHMLFTFSGNDPTNLLKKNLSDYTGSVTQAYVALRVEAHQKFIKAVFDVVSK